jgi:acylglycerol lipase
MARFEELTVTLPDGYEAYARYWPAAHPRGAVLFHHGIQSHAGWFEASATALQNAAYCVLQIDRRGCGRNQSARGHAESADQLIDDSVRAGEVLLRRSGVQKYHLHGVSWGGKLAVAHYVEHPESVNSLSLVTPGIFPRVGVSKERMAEIGFAMIYEPGKYFDIPLNEPKMFTSSPHWQRYFLEDALTLRQCTAGFYLASRRMDRTILRLKELPPIPLQLHLAADERIIDNDKTVEFIRRLEWPDTRITTYGNARHCLEFDVPDELLCEMVSFIEQSSRVSC